jgi:hypothetical protein
VPVESPSTIVIGEVAALEFVGDGRRPRPRRDRRRWTCDAAIHRRRAAPPTTAYPTTAEDITPMSWAVAISDDYDDANPRVVLTVEPTRPAGYGPRGHLDPDQARRLRGALHDALRELGESPDR